MSFFRNIGSLLSRGVSAITQRVRDVADYITGADLDRQFREAQQREEQIRRDREEERRQSRLRERRDRVIKERERAFAKQNRSDEVRAIQRELESERTKKSEETKKERRERKRVKKAEKKRGRKAKKRESPIEGPRYGGLRSEEEEHKTEEEKEEEIEYVEGEEGYHTGIPYEVITNPRQLISLQAWCQENGPFDEATEAALKILIDSYVDYIGDLVVTILVETDIGSETKVIRIKNTTNNFETNKKALRDMIIYGGIDEVQIVIESGGPVPIIISRTKLILVMTGEEYNQAVTETAIKKKEAKIAELEAENATLPVTAVNALEANLDKIRKLKVGITARRRGAFFPYLIPDKYYSEEFKEYQVYSESSDEKYRSDVPCIVYSLLKLGLITYQKSVSLIADGVRFTSKGEFQRTDLKVILNDHLTVPYLDVITVCEKNAKRYKFEAARYQRGLERKKRIKLEDVNWEVAIADFKNHFFAPSHPKYTKKAKEDYLSRVVEWQNQHPKQYNPEYYKQCEQDWQKEHAKDTRELLDRFRSIVVDHEAELIPVEQTNKLTEAIKEIKKSITMEMIFHEFQENDERKVKIEELRGAKDKESKELIKSLQKAVADFELCQSKRAGFDLLPPLIFACDCESFPVKDIHEATIVVLTAVNLLDTYEVLYKGERSEFITGKKYYLGQLTRDCMDDLMSLVERFKRPIQVWFHNVKFDLTMFLQHNTFDDICKQGSSVYSITKKHTFVGRALSEAQVEELKNISREPNRGERYSKSLKIYQNPLGSTAKPHVYRSSIEFRDFFKIFSTSLNDVAESMGIEGKLEGINYSWHTPERCRDLESNCSVLEYLDNIRDKKIPLSSWVEAWRTGGYLKNGRLWASKMYHDYCVQDVAILAKCLEKTDEMIMTLSEGEFGITDIRSAAGAAYRLTKSGFVGIHHAKGALRRYYSKFIAGGRVAVNEAIRGIVLRGLEMVPLDVGGLYPHSAVRIGEEIGGFPLGVGKPFEGNRFNEIRRSSDFYMGTFRIKKIGQRMGIPFIRCLIGDERLNAERSGPTKSELKKIRYIDDIEIVKNQTFYLTKIAVEDWENFHKVEFECEGGVYFDEGFGGLEYCEKVSSLLSARQKVKDEMKDIKSGKLYPEMNDEERSKEELKRKPLEGTLKLMANSSYGKPAQKNNHLIYSIVDNMKLDSYLMRHKDHYAASEQISEFQTLVTLDDPSDNVRMPQIVSIMILEMSRRVMNEVMYIIQVELGEMIYYMDTDSLHILKQGIPKLSLRYKEKYGKELLGKLPGQFHEDYDKDCKIKKPIITKAIYCDPKAYLEIVGSEDMTISDEYVSKRLKGVTPRGLEAKAMEYSEELESEKYLTMYKDCFKPEGVIFPLNPAGYLGVSMDFKHLGAVTNRPDGSFTRRIKFTK